MLIRDVVSSKGSSVVTVAPDATVVEVAQVLVQHTIGSVLVVEDGELLGVLTERDVLRLAARVPGLLGSTRAKEIMSTDIIVGLAEDDVAYGLAIMTNNRVRHLPVLDRGRLAGIVSIGDLVNASLTDLQAEVRWLRDYVQGGG